MFPYDQNATNQALQTLGSSYQLPSQQPAPAPVAQSAPVAPPAQPAPQAQDAEVPGIQKDGGSESGTTAQGALGGVQEGASALSSMTEDPKKKGAMDKLGGLVGTVLSMYTGNYAGAANGLSSMRGK